MSWLVNWRVHLMACSLRYIMSQGLKLEKCPAECHFLWDECKAGGLFASCFCIRRHPWYMVWREMRKTRSLTGVETDVKVNPTGYLRVRNVSIHSSLIRYRIVCGPALRMWGRTQNRAKMMTEVIAALIAPLILCTVNSGTFNTDVERILLLAMAESLAMLLTYISGITVLAGHCDADWACYQKQSFNWQAKSNLPHRHRLHIA